MLGRFIIIIYLLFFGAWLDLGFCDLKFISEFQICRHFK